MTFFRAALVASPLFFVACSSGNFEVAPAVDASAGDGATSDTGAAADAKDAASDAPAFDAASFECADPSGCAPLKPHCCVTYDLGSGAFPNCPASNVQTRCAATCTTQFPLSCPSQGRLKLCRNGDDCLSDPQNAKCCRVFQGSTSTTDGYACISEAIANAGGVPCK